MSPENAAEAARLLLAARRERRPLGPLPPALDPKDLAEGYAIQAALVALSGDRLAGYKLACTSPRAQEVIGVPGPFSGVVLACDLLASPAEPSIGRFNFAVIEPEFAVTLGTDLPAEHAPYDETQVAAAVASLHPAIEIVTSGLADWKIRGGPALTADNAGQGALVLGAGRTDWRGLDLPNHPVSLTVNGATHSQGQGRNALGGPITALAWLANHLAAQGEALKAGQVVTTGVVTEFPELASGDRALADFGALGRAEVAFQS